MAPLIRAGDVVVAMPITSETVRTGQVLLVEDPDHAGGLRLHRFVATTDAGQLVLRGDANATNDSDAISFDSVRGVGVLLVPWVGLPGLWLRHHDFAALSAAAAGALLLALLSQLDKRALRDRGAQRTHPHGRLAAGAAATVILVVATAASPAQSESAAAFSSSASNPSSSWAALSSYPCLSPAPADSPYFDYLLNATSGSTAVDSSANTRSGTIQGTTTRVAGSCVSGQSPALTLNGASGYISTPNSMVGPNTFTLEMWFNTTTATGGKLIGFGNAATGASGQYDRHLYMLNSGQIVFGVYPGAVKTITSPASYNNGAWHQVTATLSTAGMMLYVDGTRVATNSAVTTAEAFTGYWKIGYDNLNGWTTPPSSFYFAGTIDSIAVYTTALSQAKISAHFSTGH